jgi:hypothetical protein
LLAALYAKQLSDLIRQQRHKANARQDEYPAEEPDPHVRATRELQ